MADKTKNSRKFDIEIPIQGQSKLKIRNLRSQAVYNVDQQGVVDGVQVNLLKKITEAQYDALPDDVKTTQLVAVSGGPNLPQAKTEYYAILATKKEDERIYTTNKEVLDVIPLAEGATDVSARDIALFNKEAANYNEKGQGQFLNVNRNAQTVINQEEGFKDNDSRNQTKLAGNAAKPEQPLESSPIRGISNRFPSRNYDDTKYPEDMSDGQDRILFTMYEYGVKQGTQSIREQGTIKVVTGFGAREFKKLLGSVTLPIQNQISDSNRVEWGAGDLNPIQASLATSLQAFKGDIGETFKKLEGDAKALFKGTAAADIAQAVKLYFIQEAIGAKGLLSRVTGGILNPNIELLFRGPTLRPFNFRFFLSPRSKTEATQVRKIIRFFKEGMAVRESATDLFLKAPHAFEIRYVYGDYNGDHPGLNKIKKCALIGCNVDYTPDNSYMTLEDGTMTAYAITLQFQELEPITSGDYRENKDFSTGPLANPDEAFKSTAIPDDYIGY